MTKTVLIVLTTNNMSNNLINYNYRLIIKLKSSQRPSNQIIINYLVT
jgi:hypothetical protein